MREAAGFSCASPVLPLPRRKGRRVLLKLAARGGMGDVYLAATTGIEGAERPCVVKTVRRDHVHDGSFLARFLDEARVQAQLNHPGVAQVLEAATDDDGEPYTVVEYVEGRSLSEVRQRAIQAGLRLTWADVAAIALEIAQALAHVHERAGPDGTPLGIVHRDLSPQNVMLGYGGEVKLIDFGTARGHNRRCHTVAGVVFAKPGYVAPEVARQQVGDGRIDLYALGVITWELCAGRRFLASDPQQHLDDVAAGRVVAPAVADACGAPPELDDVIGMLTRNDPDDRYARASLVVPDLARLLASAPPVDGGERGVRARISALMRKLWPHEPGRARAEFARLLRDARPLLEESARQAETPAASATAGRGTGGTRTDDEPPRAADPALLAGTPYRLLRTIGEGGSGVVWEAEHVELGRRVAVKILATEHASSSAGLERFRREARALASLSHPNLVDMLDFGRALDGRVFLAMELLEGETLDVRLRRGPMSWRDAARVAMDTCDALAAAHASGLVHRDLKPENLMLVARSGGLKLLDFGVATALAQELGGPGAPAPHQRDARRTFAVFGTPEYMAPEQVAGDPIDGRADLYALGCVLYEMLTGVAPFGGSSGVEIMGKRLRDAPPSPDTRAPKRAIPAALAAVVMRALAKHPEDRFRSAALMRSALEEALSAPERRKTSARRIATASLVLTGMLGSAGASAQWTRAHPSALGLESLDAVPPARGAAAAPGRQTTAAPAACSRLASPEISGLTRPAEARPARARTQRERDVRLDWALGSRDARPKPNEVDALEASNSSATLSASDAPSANASAAVASPNLASANLASAAKTASATSRDPR
ncbi:MAG TPA: serine/threonine-protein kinase [Polyangiaceae bacterium]|nr:serine/threonine-protein kinase [Polyangiaceae bacterium]